MITNIIHYVSLNILKTKKLFHFNLALTFVMKQKSVTALYIISITNFDSYRYSF